MSPLRCVVGSSLLLAFALLSCAPEAAEPGVGFDFRMSGITRDQVGQVQITIVSQGGSLQNNDRLGRECIKDIVPNNRFVLMDDGRKSFLFDAEDGGTRTITGITVGTDYLFIGEALSKDSQKLLGQGRFAVPEIKAGSDTRVPIELKGNPDGGMLADCDPRF